MPKRKPIVKGRKHAAPKPAKPKGRKRAAPKASPKQPKTAPKPTPKLPHQPVRPPKPATGLKSARKPTPKPLAVDPFDLLPSNAPRMPGVYVGRLTKRDSGTGERYTVDGCTCIAYRRDVDGVSTVMLGQPIRLQVWAESEFDASMHPMLLKSEPYPVAQAINHYLKSLNGHTDKALRVLKRLRDGRPIEEEDTLEDLLDVTPSPHKGKRIRRQAASTTERKLRRRANRQARMAAMTPKERQEWQDKRKARRKARKLAKLAKKGK